MAITMQGSWYIQVKSKSASFAQRFVISGAVTGNGIYNGVVSTLAHATGNNWTVSIENNPGSSFHPSKERIKFPVISGGFFRFDIESDDGGGGDADFNDLILTCFTPNDGTTFLLYGNASYYDDNCMLNPCRRRYVVIESPLALKQALSIKPLYEAINKYYPHRIFETPKPPHPGDPAPVEFIPLFIPVEGDAPIPPKTGIKASLSPMTLNLSPEKSNEKTNTGLVDVNTVRSFETVRLSSSDQLVKFNPATTIDKVGLGAFIDKLFFCDHGPLTNSILRFQEYDRTNAELAGNPYTGAGHRENLGNCVTDDYGNYIFRFTRNIFDLFEEFGDIAAGENILQQVMPDIIAQLLDTSNTLNSTYESAPYWNVHLLQRLNICVPRSKIGSLPFACEGQSLIQRIGDIMVPLSAGARGTVYNSLNSSGIITAHDPNSVNVNCAAWTGRLEMWGCLENKLAKYYTVEYNNGSGWNFVTEDTSLPRMVWNPVTLQYDFPNISVNTVQMLRINGDGNPAVSTHCFLNAEIDPPSGPHNDQWMVTKRNLKAYLTTARYISTAGPVNFRLTAYKANGDNVGISESIRLYLDNVGVDYGIDPSLTMNGVTSNDCSLFCLKGAPANTPLTVKFKAIQGSGFMHNYRLYMYKGAAHQFDINPGVVNAVFVGSSLDGVLNNGRRYVFSTPCDLRFTGTNKESTADVNGYYQVDVTPASGSWLSGDETFCAFTIQLDGNIRHTDGKTGNPYFYTPPIAIGIQKTC